jgi:hypothetical protein
LRLQNEEIFESDQIRALSSINSLLYKLNVQ